MLERGGCEGRSTPLLHSWFVQRGDRLILRTLSPNFALTPKLQHYQLIHVVVGGLRLNPQRIRSNLDLSGGMSSKEWVSFQQAGICPSTD